MYDYIKHAYGKDFSVGDRVLHTETRKMGTVVAPKSHEHYVSVLFTGHGGPAHCHPLALQKL